MQLARRDDAVGAICEIAETCTVSDMTAALESLGEFKALNQTPEAKALFDHYVAAVGKVGLEVVCNRPSRRHPTFTQGVSRGGEHGALSTDDGVGDLGDGGGDGFGVRELRSSLSLHLERNLHNYHR